MEIKKQSNIKIKYADSTWSLYLSCKRALDIVISILGLLIISPILILVILVIKLEDFKGTAFFKQIRIGKDGKKFVMYKFRSMYVNSEKKLEELIELNEVKGAMFKMKQDPRITKVGKFIRKYSVDEIPQLVNVLKGDMSLIGPRPPLIREVNSYTEYDKQRLLIKPGITGLWQVSGRNSLSFEEMVALDLEYIQTRSLFLDFKILLKTIVVVITSSNAY